MKIHVRTFFTVLLLSAAAYAQDQGNPPPPANGPGGPPGGRPMMACRDDIKTYCQGVQPGGGRIINCLQDHYKDVSDGCYSILQKVEARRGSGSDAPPPPAAGDQDSGGPQDAGKD